MAENDIVRVYAGLTPAQHAVAKNLADRRGLSMSALLRTLMLEAAAREGIAPEAYAYDEKEPPHA